MTGSILLSGEERGGSDGTSIVTGEATTSGRQKRARRYAVGRGNGQVRMSPGHPQSCRGHDGLIMLRASIALSGLPGPAFGSLLLSRLPRPIPIHLLAEFGP